MRRARLSAPLAAAVAAVGAAAAVAWLLTAEAQDVRVRLPGQEDSLALLVRPLARPRNTGTTIPGPGRPSALGGSWPQFRGADRTNIVRDAPALARAWP